MRFSRPFTNSRRNPVHGVVSERPRAEKVYAPVVELDRWQLTGLLFGVLVIAAGAFFVGRSTGNVSAPQPVEAVTALAKSLPVNANSRARQIALAEVWPPTTGIDESLSRPIQQPLPSDPTERARAQAHLQLQAARSNGLRDDAPPPIVAGGASLPTVTPHAPATGPGGFTLQISLFDSQAAAQVIATQLETTGSPVRIRQVRSSDMRDLFRVEVGDFTSSEAALAFQRRFERDTGYSGVLITL